MRENVPAMKSQFWPHNLEELKQCGMETRSSFSLYGKAEALSSKRTRWSVSGKENRALNTNRDKMEQAKTNSIVQTDTVSSA